ncbi:MAG: serine hydrolase domain-containing protein [Halieaceae bacterium]
MQQLIDSLEELRISHEVAAFGLLIIEKDAVVTLSTRGVANRDSDEPISDDAVFRIGSISKLFTGLVAAQLSADNVLDLDTPIKRWPVNDAYTNPWTDKHPVTTAQLLEHTAGLTDLSKPEWDYSDPRQLPLGKTLRLHPDARTAQWAPGLHYSYSNAGAGLAAYVMELATDKPYEQLLQEIVLTPLAMNSTSALPPSGNRLAQGYNTDGRTPIPYWHQIFRPFGAINSTLADMSKLLRVLLNKGTLDGQRFYTEAVIERTELLTTSLASRNGLQHGYGLGNYNWYRDGIEFHGHGGDADGYLSRMGYNRTTNSGYFLVITAFQPATLKKMTTLVEKYLIRDAASPPAAADWSLTDDDIAAITGNYERTTRRFPTSKSTSKGAVLRIFSRDSNALYYQHGEKKPVRLLPVTDNLFRHENEVTATLFIGAGEDGDIYFQSGSDNFRRISATETGGE